MSSNSVCSQACLASSAVPRISHCVQQEDTIAGLATFRAVVPLILRSLSYDTPVPEQRSSSTLLDALTVKVYSWNVQGSKSHYWNTVCRYSVAMAELSYQNHDFDVKLQIARFTWFMIYIDDLARTIPAALQDFQLGMLQGQIPSNTVLRHF
ncbi:hypothetical protein C8J56DRAFT_1046586 [Mycena floridula]|nr:hypothetical protein C8J56DRAFT_1046586 [Mycena floridula]